MNVALIHNSEYEFSPISSVPIKNAAVAERIAGILGGSVCELDEVGDSPYLIPIEPITREVAEQYGVTGEGDV
jgi:hypothetical protein